MEGEGWKWRGKGRGGAWSAQPPFDLLIRTQSIYCKITPEMRSPQQSGHLDWSQGYMAKTEVVRHVSLYKIAYIDFSK